MLGGRIHTNVAEAEVERDQHALLAATDVHELGVGRAGQPLVGDGVALMAVGLEQVLGGGGDVLVELDPHEVADRAWISCLASQAP